ncbi:Stf0 family sulfotransferase [Phenylobacterium sp.]|uniref:Stf0 family sulfotransferase n=1 Tax=Phenylobacterium sp. TaxID=1871053 RepID=UPI0027343999|nr:Stf0 family sulfotransferase [Phenylobacterium sp.]MDP3853871.1 Stf0 family sulfotransferase [Phenylobacterium sp.]
MLGASSYLICATPRSGTTLLCDLLADTGVSGRPNSYYRRPDISKRAQSWGLSRTEFADDIEFNRMYLAAALREGTGETGIFGLRIMWDSVAELTTRLRLLYPSIADDAALIERAFGKPLYIHVSRVDKTAQAISLLKAERSGLWHVAADGSERQRTGPPQPAQYDAERIASIIRELESDEAAWECFFASHHIQPVRVTYEALADDPRQVLRTLLSSLGCTPEAASAVTVKTARMADVLSREWADRFRRSVAALN